MKGGTPLDYAEFQLTPKRTRCELFVSSDGLLEKLASGFVKPFVAHLRAVEAQIAKGCQIIRLETKSGNEKHSLCQQSDEPWFCKGTIERFVRFVSTPEVMERVKTIEDELTQLEQVRIALVNTFAKTPDRFPYGDDTTGHQRSREATNTLVPRRFSTDNKDNEPDASKKELLRAMEARLNALHQEQNLVFSRANAAGFDNKSIANLMTFAKRFGADRLHDACTHFLALLRKKTVPKGGQECINSSMFETPSDVSACTLTSAFETPPDVSACTLTSAFGTMLVSKEEEWLQSAKRKLDFGAPTSQDAKSGGFGATGIDPAKREIYQKEASTTSTSDQIAELTESRIFFARLQQMAQQVDARSKEDFGWQIDGDKELTFQDSENDAASLIQNKISNSVLPERSASLPTLRVRTEGSPRQNSTLVEAETAESKNEVSKGKDSARTTEETFCTETDKSNGAQGDAPARRLSVQAAISLFESKKKDSNEPPLRKLTKQESRKTLSESGNSPSEKSVLKRWSGQTPCSPEANNVQEKKVLDIRVSEARQGLDLVKVEGEAAKLSPSQREVDDTAQATPDEEARERFKKSSSSILQHESEEHLEQSSESGSMSMDANARHIKHLSPSTQHPSNNTGGSNMRLDPINLSSLDQNLLTTKMDVEKVESEPTIIGVPAKLNLPKKPAMEVKPISEVKPDDQPVPSRTSIVRTKRPEQEQKDTEMLKTHNAKELLPKQSQTVPHRSRPPPQVPAAVSSERENVGSLAVAASEPEQVLEKKTETIKHKEVPASDRRTGRNTSSAKPSVQKKLSAVKELPTNLLTSSVDCHMQALVRMVEHQYTNMSFNGVEIANDQKGEQRGRFYDQYAKVREAKLRKEHPAKRAEREAKLKSMQETLDKRKAEMETKAVRLSRKTVRDAHVADTGGERMPQNTAVMVEQKDPKDEDDDTDQEEYSLKPQEKIPDYSSPTSAPSTLRSSKSLSFPLKLQAPTKAVPTLSKTVSSSRNSARGSASSQKATPKSPGGVSNQGKPSSLSSFSAKPSSLSSSSADTTVVKSVLYVKDIARTGSARVHPRLNGSSSEGTTLVDDPNNVTRLGNTEREEPKHQLLLTKKNVDIFAMSRGLPTEDGILLGSPMDQQGGVTDVLDSRNAPNSGATQEAKPFLRKGQGIGPGAGPGIIKQKASILVESSKNPDEETSTHCKQDVYAEPEDIKSTSENSLEVFEANHVRVVQDQDSSSSGTEMTPNVMDESVSPSSRPSTGTTESGEVEALDDLPGSISQNEKADPVAITCNEKPEEIGQGVIESGPQGSFLQVINHKQKEGTLLLSDLLSQKSSDPVTKNVGHVASSVSFREASLFPHGQIESSFPASVSHPYSSMLQRGAVSSRFSPPRADLHSNSPASWNLSQSSRYMQEAELGYSGKRLRGHQKQASMLPLPPKEPSKGFKRLLHFGRKSRTSETITDCVSVSTTSEGDDDADDVRESGSHLSDELLQKIRMQKRGFENGNMGDQVSYPYQDTPQFFGSAIPPPPANFKLREEHLSGGNLIKAPRSFFSLSSFRTKGTEGKSR